MEKNETLPHELAGGRGEGSSTAPQNEEGAEKIIAEKGGKYKFWIDIDTDFLRRCKQKWNGSGEDVYSQAKVLFFERQFEPRNRPHAMARATFLAREVARKLRRWRHTADGVVILPPSEKAAKKPAADAENRRDPRIDVILSTAGECVGSVIRAVRDGENICTACRAAGISYASFIAAAREAYRQPGFWEEA